jgi:hypothetical protein
MRMWRADGSGRPRIPEGDLDPVLYKPLWGEVEVNPAKRNDEKEMLRASESIEKKGFIINGIAKYIQYWGPAWLGMRGMPQRCHVSSSTGNESIEGLLVRYPFNQTICRRDSGRCRTGGGTTPGGVPRRMAQRIRRTIHLRTTPCPIHFVVRPRTDRGRTSTPTTILYSGILSSATPVIITTSPCGWVVL